MGSYSRPTLGQVSMNRLGNTVYYIQDHIIHSAILQLKGEDFDGELIRRARDGL